MSKHGPQDVGALACEGDDGLDVMFSLAPLAVVVCSAVGMVAEGAKGTLIKDALEISIAAACSAQRSGMTASPTPGHFGSTSAGTHQQRKAE
jgi:hypothetical protein